MIFSYLTNDNGAAYVCPKYVAQRWLSRDRKDFLLNATINLFVATRWSIKNRDAYHNKWKWEKSLDVVSMDNYSSSRGQLTNYNPSDRVSELTANKTHYLIIICFPKKTIPKKIYQNYGL